MLLLPELGWQVWGEICRDYSQFPIKKDYRKSAIPMKMAFSALPNWDLPVDSKINYELLELATILLLLEVM